MATAAETLADFALGLTYDQIPAEVVERAKACIIDTIAVSTFGAAKPWSKIVAAHVKTNGASGPAKVLGSGLGVSAPFAALANATQTHAFEFDTLCHPSVGIHPGAALLAPGLAVGQTLGVSGKDLIAAFVAGQEVMYRIGDAARESSEKLGFHAPGLNGVFGGAVTAGRLMKLDPQRLAAALGIGGSLCGGIMEFSKSGGMVKCLHIGRAAEAAVTAAGLARDGFTGPSTVLEGKFGFLNVYCRDGDAARLTKGFGEVWHTLKIMVKRYSCHITAHVPATVLLQLKAEHKIGGDDIQSITVVGSEKMVSHHFIPEPRDMTMAQYSTPFCAALTCYRDPRDPAVFSQSSLEDPAIRDLCRRVKVEASVALTKGNRLACQVRVVLKNGKELVKDGQDFPGMPQRPLNREELGEKFLRLMASGSAGKSERLLAQLFALEEVGNVAEITVA